MKEPTNEQTNGGKAGNGREWKGMEGNGREWNETEWTAMKQNDIEIYISLYTVS